MNQTKEARTLSVIDPLTEPVFERRPLGEEAFRRIIGIERKRTERSKAPFVLALLQEMQPGDGTNLRTLDLVMSILLGTSRDTDLVGWYKEKVTVGALFTGLLPGDKGAVIDTIRARVRESLREKMSPQEFGQIGISLHYYPDEWDEPGEGGRSNPVLYPDLWKPNQDREPHQLLKRMIDVVCSAILFFLCLPVCLAIALAIKLTSSGPILFRQTRVGQHGKQFEFLKFRSMYVNNDHSVHRQYVTKLINEQASTGDGKTGGVFKLTNDKRITPVGRFLRKTSLDELPQFLNVLRGEMSLVGPRPPIPYELAAYQTWHRRRLLEVKPGITGLWQVTARSSVNFDDMVRLDLKYANSWTPWLDLKILLKTPLAVIRGSGAY